MKSGAEIRSLTGLRGVAALWIVIYHFHHRHIDGTQWYWQILERGYLAVDIFFVLSGFVLALSYGHLFADGFKLRSYTAFMLRRIARIYPLYLLVVLLVIAGTLTPSPYLHVRVHLSWVGYLANIFMVQTWGIAPSIVGPSWSLSVELAAYILFPLLVTVVLRSKGTFACAAVVAGYMLLALAVEHGILERATRVGSLDVTSPYSGITLLRCLVEFSGGIFAYRLSTAPRLKRILASRLTAFSMVAIAVALMVIPGTDFAISLTFPLTVAALAVGRNGVSALLSTAAPFFLGEISYSLYMLHVPLLRLCRGGRRFLEMFLDPSIAGYLFVIASYVVLFVVATWTHEKIEIRARRYIQHLASRPTRLAVEKSEAAGQADLLR